jgi:5-formyltetrahydrofolate cyclo-ligase
MKKQKQKLRSEIKNALSSMAPELIESKSRAIAARVCGLTQYKNAEIVLGYIAMKGEADVADILHAALKTGKQIAVPRMQGVGSMAFHELSSLAGPWDEHSYGIKEPPESKPVIHPRSCSGQNVLILVPGLAFDRKCRRLGRGTGFYDRYLSMGCDNAATVGIALACQLVHKIPVSDHDIPLDCIVTEEEVIFP